MSEEETNIQVPGVKTAELGAMIARLLEAYAEYGINRIEARAVLPDLWHVVCYCPRISVEIEEPVWTREEDPRWKSL